MDPIAFAVPVFMGLFGLEVWAARRKGASLVRFADSMSDLSCGVMQQVLKVFLVALTAGAYIWVEEHVGLFELSASDPWVWVATFFGVDFCYYWFHRLSHQINFLWAAHVVHHQSEEYNLSVALRQSALQPGFSWVFYLPLAVLGVPPLVFFVHVSVNTLYQFWIHTRLIGRMGPLELFLNTPSHHRVHHGQNPQYIDRNHAGTLIIWDKLFGTFEPEGEEVVYGITEPSESFNPFWVNLHSWVLTARRAARTRRWGDKLRLFLKPPGWLPDDLAGDKAPRAWPPPKYDPAVPAAVRRYTLWHFALVVAVMPGFLLLKHGDQPGLKVALGAAVLLALASLNGLNEGRSWARWLELVRLGATAVGVAAAWPASYPALAYVLPPMVLGAALSAFALLR
ncbi:MAG: sterol desaturase family protein, partial [Deltaproteobacteria bacterium]|nr:sterol desaturase family protein [Deltaproteobacteria bacterium]